LLQHQSAAGKKKTGKKPVSIIPYPMAVYDVQPKAECRASDH